MKLLNKLNTTRLHNIHQPKGSIMLRGELCDCDTDYLCEHRLQVIADWIKENQK